MPDQARSRKILIVDDSASTRLLERLMLEKEAEFTVFEAVNGRDAIEKALVIQPDLILMDIMMPELNGIDACEQIKQCAETAATAVIIVSALSSVEWQESAAKAGAQAFLMKPVTKSVLLQTMYEILHFPHERETPKVVNRLYVNHE